MSGGSLDYLYRREPEEQLGLLLRYLDEIHSSLDRSLKCKIRHELNTHNLTEDERISVTLAKEEIDDIAEKVRFLSKRVGKLNNVLQAIEWELSGDSDLSSVVLEAVRWSKENR